MSKRIRKGNHYDDDIFSSCPFIGKKSMTRYVRFHESWRYTLPSPHQADVNKLFGMSFGFFALHQDSARFGAYYEPADDSVVLVPYCYIDGQRNWNEFLQFPEVARVKIGQELILRLGKHANGFYYFTARDADEKVLGMYLSEPWKKEPPSYGATHGTYFGGDCTAPHDILTDISKHPLR